MQAGTLHVDMELALDISNSKCNSDVNAAQCMECDEFLSLPQNVILDEGESYAALLYTWRSMSRAVPAVSYMYM